MKIPRQKHHGEADGTMRFDFLDDRAALICLFMKDDRDEARDRRAGRREMTSVVGRRPRTAPEVWRVLQAIWRATDGCPQAWRELDGLGLSENRIGVQRAVTEGLLLVESGHSACITDAGRRVLQAA
jgi:hypothetical protein